MRLRSFISFIARGAIALPLFAFGHGTEMLDARFEFDERGAVRLKITADFSGNPMLTTEAEARAALGDALRVKFDGAEHKLSDLSPLTVERSTQPDADSPMPRAPVDPSLKHELLVAKWRWVPTTSRLMFVVPTESKQTTLFWMNEPNVKEHRWMMLLANDSTPMIAVPKVTSLSWAWIAAAVGIVWVAQRWLATRRVQSVE